MIDLHCHSLYSDGLLAPADLFKRALQSEIRILALTDHDTTEGLAHLHAAAATANISIINGIEFSTRWKKHDIHIVGLGIQLDSDVLNMCVKEQTHSRIERAIEIGKRLSRAGVSSAYEKACKVAGHERVSRPHFAEVLIQEGIVKDMKSAFTRFLARGKPAYVETNWTPIAEIIRVIHVSGGLSVLAHPLKYKLTRMKLNALISAFKDAGGAGMEVVSGLMTTLEVEEMAKLSQKYELLASTGSDFHGEGVSRVGLGRQIQLPSGCTPIWTKLELH